MGNITSYSNLEVAQPLGPEWVKESRESYCAVLRNIETGQQAEQYVVNISESIPAEFERYDYRLHQNQNLVSTWAVQHVGDEGVCNGLHKLLVTNERIPLRLSEVSGINFQDAITVIYSSFVGFHAIHEVEGYVSVTDEMIGFTPDHRVKVWLNENFSQNHPALLHRMVNQQYSASTMIEEIITAVEQHAAQPLLPNFRNYFKSRFAPTGSFGTALAIVRDFAQSNGLLITNKMTFAEGAPITVASTQYQTSHVYPEVPIPVASTSTQSLIHPGARQTVLQVGQPVVSIVSDPPIVSYIQQPQQIVSEEPIVQAVPFSFIAPQSTIAAPLPTAISQITPVPAVVEQRIVPSIVQTNPLSRSAHFGRPVIAPIQSPIGIQTTHLSNSVHGLITPKIQPVTQIPRPAALSNYQTNVNQIGLVTRDVPTATIATSNVIQNHPRIQKGNNLLEAERYLQNLKTVQSARVSPHKVVSPQPIRYRKPDIQTLFERKSQTNIGQTQGTVIQTSHFGHNIGQTLHKYGSRSGAISIASPQVATVVPIRLPNQRPPQPPLPPGARVQVNETRTINIDGVATIDKLDQSQQIFNLNEPKTPIHEFKDHPNRGVVEGLQEAIKQIGDISVTGSNIRDVAVTTITTQKKQYDLIEQMKTHLDANAGAIEDRNITHSFGQAKEQGGSQYLLSQDVRDLLKNYDNNGATYASGYAVNSQYKSTSGVQDPIIIFNQDLYNRVESKGEYGYRNQSKGYEAVTYEKSSDDYEALRAKYSTKYDDLDNKYQTKYDDTYGVSKKHETYKATQYRSDYNTHNLGESKYLKDYTSDQQNIDDPLIVFNTKKSDLGARDSLGYKVSIGKRGGDYDQYRKQLKNSGDNKYDTYQPSYSKYDNKYESKYDSKYGSRNDIQYDRYESKYDRYHQKPSRYEDSKYQSKHNRYDGGSSKYGERQNDYHGGRKYSSRQDQYQRNYREDRNNRQTVERQPSTYHRQERYESSRYERRNEKVRNPPRNNRDNNRNDKYEKRQSNYDNYERRGDRDGARESARERRDSYKEYKDQKKNISYNELQSLLYE